MTKRTAATPTIRNIRRVALVAAIGLTAGACGGTKDKTQGAVAAPTSTTSATSAPAAPTTTSTEATTTTRASTATSSPPTTVTTKQSTKTEAVTIKLYAFGPNPFHVPVGTSVTWTNQDEILHTVTAGTRTYDDQHLQKDIIPGPPGFNFMLDGKGTTATYTFATAGTFNYICSRHPGMDAQIVVG